MTTTNLYTKYLLTEEYGADTVEKLMATKLVFDGILDHHHIMVHF